MNREHIREFCPSCFDLLSIFSSTRIRHFPRNYLMVKCGSKAILLQPPSLKVKMIDNQMRIFDDRPILLNLFFSNGKVKKAIFFQGLLSTKVRETWDGSPFLIIQNKQTLDPTFM